MLLGAFLYFLFLYHVLWTSFELLVHRTLMHNHYAIHIKFKNLLRFLLWLTFGLAFKNWQQHLAASHRKHHLYSDQPEDPFSPYHYKFFQMFDYKHNEQGRPHFVSQDDLKKFAPEIKTDDSWIEVNFYQKYPNLGLNLLWVSYVLLFGMYGLFIGGIHRFYINEIVIFNANYATHKLGFRYVKLAKSDKAVNIFPLGILMAGEELHANHHKYPNKLNYAIKWFEFDLGYWYARFFVYIGLMKIKSQIRPSPELVHL